MDGNEMNIEAMMGMLDRVRLIQSVYVKLSEIQKLFECYNSGGEGAEEGNVI